MGSPGQSIWCEESVNSQIVHDAVVAATTPGICSVVQFICVEKLRHSIREELLKTLSSCASLQCDIFIISGSELDDAFGQFAETMKQEITQDSLSRLLQGDRPTNQGIMCWIVAGAAGTGKSHWIREHVAGLPADARPTDIIRFVIHEGFSVDGCIARITAASTAENHVLAIHFDVTIFGDLTLLSRFLHNLFVHGVMIDESTGRVLAIPLEQTMHVYIELPAIDAIVNEHGEATQLWPPDETSCTASSHPYLLKLPVLSIITPISHYASISSPRPYVVDDQARFVASYLHLRQSEGERFGCNALPDFEAIRNTPIISDEECLAVLATLWTQRGVPTSKKVRSGFIRLLFNRCNYLRLVKTTIESHYGDEFLNTLYVRFAGSRQGMLSLDQLPRLNFFKAMDLFLAEAMVVASESRNLSADAASVWSILPKDPLEGFDFLITAESDRSSNYGELFASFPGVKSLLLNDGSIPSVIRAMISPAFGVTDTGEMINMLTDCGHILTSASVMRLLHMHCRREINHSVISEGETGVGKSQNFVLYSLLINANAALFTNLKLHLVAVISTFATFKESEMLAQGIAPSGEMHRLSCAESCWNLDSLLLLVDAVCVQSPEGSNFADEIGMTVCSYFDELFKSYPLHFEGLKECAKCSFLSFKRSHSMSRADIIQRLTQICRQAARAPYLPIIPPAQRDPVAAYVNERVQDSHTKFDLESEDEEEEDYDNELTARRALATNHINLFISFATGEVASFELESSETFLQLKERIAVSRRCPVAAQRLTFAGRVVADTDRLRDVNAQNESTIFCSLMEANGGDNDSADSFDGDSSHALFGNETSLHEFLRACATAPPAALYHRILADESLTAERWRNILTPIVEDAKKLQLMSPSAVICVFVDELNTATSLGMIDEAFTSQSMDGMPLPSNLFFAGAINPLRTTAPPTAEDNEDLEPIDFTRSNIGVSTYDVEDNSKDYLAGKPYIVRAMSARLSRCCIWYPRLGDTPNAEKYFLAELLKGTIPASAPHWMAEELRSQWGSYLDLFLHNTIKLVTRAQNLVKEYNIPRVIVSIRDLVRTVKLLLWFLTNAVPIRIDGVGKVLQYRNIFLPEWQDSTIFNGVSCHMHHALIMAIATSYLFRLPSEGRIAAGGRVEYDYRNQFVAHLADGRDDFNVEFFSVVESSLDHVWKYSIIEKGLAPTSTLKENYYCMLVAIINKIPLLITGPPGCGKTLSLVLACKNLTGPTTSSSIPFQHIAKAHKFPYQCSSESTSLELSIQFQRALKQQQQQDSYERERGKHICVVSIDEAGLPPERRQALKALHDWLENAKVACVMMSNVVLDAAKTSRSLQVMQTQVNAEDLRALCRGLLTDADYQGERLTETRLEGLCEAFQTLRQVVVNDNWFHQRDFVFFCRMLRKIIIASEQSIPGLFNASWLLMSLRRNFQTLNPNHFSTLAWHFLKHTHLEAPGGDILHAQVMETLRESLLDRVDDDTEAAAHCRYIAIIDPTDSEVTIELLFEMKFLERSDTKIIAISEFPEDGTATQISAVLGRIKYAIETGMTLLLSNSSSVESALYDVINRHHEYSVNSSGRREAWANISLGSFSRYVKVHPDFRLILHIPIAKLPSTPLPLLNRLEKYFLSISDALASKVQQVIQQAPLCLRTLRSRRQNELFFQALYDGVSDFVQQCGGPASFYGFSSSETVAALILRAVDDACSELTASMEEFHVRPSILTVSGYQLEEDQSDVNMVGHEQFENGHDHDEDAVVGAMESKGPELEDFIDWRLLNHVDDSKDTKVDSSSVLLIHQVGKLVRRINFQLLECARCEIVYSLRETLPQAYLLEYTMAQEHFDATELVRRFVHLSMGRLASKQRTEKLVLYTRSDNTILQLVTSDRFAAATLRGILCDTDGNTAEVSIVRDPSDIPSCSGTAKVVVFPLASFRTSNACEQSLRSCMNLSTSSTSLAGQVVLLVVADMRQCGSRHVTAARRFVDEGFVQLNGSSQAVLLVVVFILHVPPQRLQLRSCYQTIPINGWSSVYVDNFSTQVKLINEVDRDEELPMVPVSVSDRSVRGWINLIMGIVSENQSAVIIDEFKALSRDALWHAIQSCQFKQTQGGRRARRETFSAMGIDLSMPAYFDGRHDWVFQQLDSRPSIINAIVSIFTELWVKILSGIIEETCVTITRAATSKGLLQTLQSSFKWLLSDFMKDTVSRYIGAMWTLESIAAMDTLRGEVDISNSSSEVMAYLGRSEIFHFIFLNALYHSISVNAGRQLFMHDFETASSCLTKSVKDCWEVPCAPTVPLFPVIAAAVEELIFFARHIVKEDGDRWMPEVSELERELNVIYKIVNYSPSSVSIPTTKWTYLIRIIRAVEANCFAWDSWQLDFMRLSLACHQRSASEAALLKFLAHQIVADVRRNFAIVQSDNYAYDRDICLWTMLQFRLRRELGEMITLLDFVKGLVSERQIEEITGTLGANDVPMDALQYQPPLEHLQGQEETGMRRVVAMVLSSGLDEMWQRLNSLLGEHDLMDWMTRMRVLLSLIPANPAATVRLLEPKVFCR